MKYLQVSIAALLSLTMASCAEEKKPQLLGKWQEVAIINPELDAAMHRQSVFADTVGSSTDSARNQTLYGTANIAQMRASLKANLDSFRKAQFYAIKATKFDFRKDGLMFIHSNAGIDSCKWYLDEDGALILDEAKLKGGGNQIRMEIAHLSDTLLKLQFTEQYLTSTAVFKPIKE